MLPKAIRAKIRMPLETRCWEWQGVTWNGYGHLTRDGKTHLAHRYVYELLVGPVPAGLELDHLCFNPRCVKPSHLEPVTMLENKRRAAVRRAAIGLRYRKLSPKWKQHRTHCRRGHPWPESTFVNSQGNLVCRECKNLRQRSG